MCKLCYEYQQEWGEIPFPLPPPYLSLITLSLSGTCQNFSSILQLKKVAVLTKSSSSTSFSILLILCSSLRICVRCVSYFATCFISLPYLISLLRNLCTLGTFFFQFVQVTSNVGGGKKQELTIGFQYYLFVFVEMPSTLIYLNFDLYLFRFSYVFI